MTPAVIKQAIAELKDKQRAGWKQYQDAEAGIKSLQSLCQHDWRYEGHSHNDDHYTCTICGAEETQ